MALLPDVCRVLRRWRRRDGVIGREMRWAEVGGLCHVCVCVCIRMYVGHMEMEYLRTPPATS